MSEPDYPLIAALGLAVRREPVPHIRRDELVAVLRDRGSLEDFRRLAPVAQTQHADGPYLWDVEPVLRRLFGG
jgi:hypothetical protein